MCNQTSTTFAITRIANACVLLEIGTDTFLTDPFFWNPSYMGIDESVAMQPEQLPRLSAIIGGHSVIDHWQIQTMSSYPYKEEVPVFVATLKMAQQAQAVGFRKVEVLEWGDRRQISQHLTLETVKAHQGMGLKVNNYILRTPEVR